MTHTASTVPLRAATARSLTTDACHAVSQRSPHQEYSQVVRTFGVVRARLQAFVTLDFEQLDTKTGRQLLHKCTNSRQGAQQDTDITATEAQLLTQLQRHLRQSPAYGDLTPANLMLFMKVAWAGRRRCREVGFDPEGFVTAERYGLAFLLYLAQRNSGQNTAKSA